MQFVDCPLHQRKLTLNLCEQCRHHEGVKVLVMVELIGPQGERAKSERREVLAKELPEMTKQLGERAQVSERSRWVDCHYPRMLLIDVVHGALNGEHI